VGDPKRLRRRAPEPCDELPPLQFLPGKRLPRPEDDPLVLTVPWSKTPHRRHRDVIAPEGASRTQVFPTSSDTRTKLVTAIARGRQWLAEIEAAAVTVAVLPYGKPAASATST
jgi:hypothetical protein